MNTELIFQIIDWSYFHDDVGEEEVFAIRVYGRTKDDKTVYLQIDGFTPYFYVEIPPEWKQQQINAFVDIIKSKVPKHLQNGLINHDKTQRYNFWKFNGEQKQPFLRLIFNNYNSFRAYEKVFQYKIYNRYLANTSKKYKLYESNVEPMLRCMHTIGVTACGWVSVPYNKCCIYKDQTAPTSCDINVSTDWQFLKPVKDNAILPLVIASFDIECVSGDGNFPQPHRIEDKIIQIGTTFSRYGSPECFYKHIITLDTCDPLDGVDVESYTTEKEVLIAWTKLIQKINPDIMIGYNIFGFDYNYLYERSKKMGCETEFSKLCRLKLSTSKFVVKDLSSSAMGENKLKFYEINGRINIDLYKVIMRDYKLQSYKLDTVASTFIQDEVKQIIKNDNIIYLYTSGANNVAVGQYITINYNDGLSDNQYGEGHKFQIISKNKSDDGKQDIIVVSGDLDKDFMDQLHKFKLSWSQSKDDVSPNEIFKFQKMGAKERAIIAKYCIQDCALCNRLIDKLQIITNNVGMANVCHVPLSYIFLRGQGIKIFSLVSKKCRELEYVIPVVKKKFKPEDKKLEKMINDNIYHTLNKWRDDDHEDEEEEDQGYEGATVFDPQVGVHYDAIPVLDYSSLYPRSMIHRNISHEMLIEEENIDKFKNLSDEYFFHKVTYKNSNETNTICCYAQRKDKKMGILPLILQELLDARKKTNNEMFNEPDKFKKQVLDGLQLAYKITANSLYGQTGAPTSPIFLKHVAASTTATGREMLTYAKRFIERILTVLLKLVVKNKPKKFNKYMKKLFKLDVVDIENGLPFFSNDDTKETVQNIIDKIFVSKTIDPKMFIDKGKNPRYSNQEEFISWYWSELKHNVEGKTLTPRVIYGDTDSIFISFNLIDNETKKPWQGLEARRASINLGVLAGELIHVVLPPPHDLEYEKTFDPFCILTKKRYVGNLYEHDPTKYKQKSMGIVLKRRDNAQIVKIIVGGIVHKILDEKSPEKAVEFTKNALKDVLNKKYPMSKFIITKTLKTTYKNRSKLAHVVLADRLGDRDPGNKPMSNDRLLFAYIETKHLKCQLCDGEIDTTRCKCRSCMGMFCISHLYNHRKSCVPMCSLSRERDKKILKNCNTCKGYYSLEKNEEGETWFDRHMKRTDKDTEEVFYDKCKKPLSESILQGDIVETPEYIVKNNLNLDYLFYITNQIMLPSLQFLSLIAHNPEKIFDSFINREINKRKRKKPIQYYFGKFGDKDESDDDNKCELIDKLNSDFGEAKTKESTPKKAFNRKIKQITPKELIINETGGISIDF
jgi:DNA polymerase elongation subunit (family B)